MTRSPLLLLTVTAVTLATFSSADAKIAALKAKRLRPGGAVMLNPQPLPPKDIQMLNPQPLPPRLKAGFVR